MLVALGMARLAPEWPGSPWSKGLRAINFNVLTERAGTDGFLQQGGIRSDTTDIFGALVYWLVLLATLVIAFNGLGLTNITDLLGQLLSSCPS